MLLPVVCRHLQQNQAGIVASVDRAIVRLLLRGIIRQTDDVFVL